MNWPSRMPASKPFGREIDQLLACGDLHLDLGIGLAERRDQRLQQDRHHRARHREAQQSGRPLSEVTRDLACGDQLLEGGLCARQESFAGFGQADAARRAYEERRADARLERAHRLADRRRRHPEFRGRSAKTAVLGNAQERLHAVERALPDCEVLLHGPSTLSRIVARRKRSHVWAEDHESRWRNCCNLMTDVLDGVRDHYRATGLTERLKTALAALGPEDQQLTPQQLAALDQFHTRGLAATAELAKLAGITAGMSVLDVGSGVGGPARFLAATYGCQVTGVDLSEPFVDAARYLTERTGQSGQVSFETASALELPFDDGRFDVALLQHVAMNIADRPRLYREIRRVLKSGGMFATFDVVSERRRAALSRPLGANAGDELSPDSRTRHARRSSRPVSAPWHGTTTPRPPRPGSPSCARRVRRLRPISAW